MNNLKNQYALGQIAKVKSGFTFRERIVELDKGDGNAHVVQIKDARKIADESFSHEIHPALLPEIEWQGKDTAFGTSESVFIPSRGGYFKSFCLTTDTSQQKPVVISSQFLIITPENSVSAQFLCWYLNQPVMQRVLAESSQGSNMVMLNTEIVKNIKISVPPITIQQQILHMHKMWQREQQLTAALAKNREQMMQGIFNELLKETN